jgi:hypothetical protein
MQAYAEGFSIMKAKKESLGPRPAADLEIWRYGSVVRSWLLDLTADALKKNPTLDGLEAYVADSGEGRWTVFRGDRPERLGAGDHGIADSPAAFARGEQLHRPHARRSCAMSSAAMRSRKTKRQPRSGRRLQIEIPSISGPSRRVRRDKSMATTESQNRPRTRAKSSQKGCAGAGADALLSSSALLET